MNRHFHQFCNNVVLQQKSLKSEMQEYHNRRRSFIQKRLL